MILTRAPINTTTTIHAAAEHADTWTEQGREFAVCAGCFLERPITAMTLAAGHWYCTATATLPACTVA
jgi:hypothetical protein